MFVRLIAALCLLTVLPAIAWPTRALSENAEVSDCDWQASARNIGEPWEDHTRTFSSGKTRLALLDTVEPAAGAVHLLILSPPYSELGDRQCKTIGIAGMGFANLQFDALRASYNPATGLDFTVPVQVFDAASAGFLNRTLWLRLNQATGDILTELR